jgi:hypothetical protein
LGQKQPVDREDRFAPQVTVTFSLPATVVLQQATRGDPDQHSVLLKFGFQSLSIIMPPDFIQRLGNDLNDDDAVLRNCGFALPQSFCRLSGKRRSSAETICQSQDDTFDQI